VKRLKRKNGDIREIDLGESKSEFFIYNTLKEGELPGHELYCTRCFPLSPPLP
jgi:hypothetical protein